MTNLIHRNREGEVHSGGSSRVWPVCENILESSSQNITGILASIK